MTAYSDNLHAAIEALGKSIASIDVGNRQTIKAVRKDFAIVERRAAAVERHAGNLAAALGFDCSPPGQVEL